MNKGMTLPLCERVTPAQTLWQSIDAGLADAGEQAALRDAGDETRSFALVLS
jgi:hypothetical protein